MKFNLERTDSDHTRRYFARLKGHPGLPVVAILTVGLMLAGVSNKSMPILVGITGGAASVLPFWLIVLWTARTQPLPPKEDRKISDDYEGF